VSPADRANLEELALQYAMAIRMAMLQFRRSGKMRVDESQYTTYTITRGPVAGPFASVRTAAHYDSSAAEIEEQLTNKLQWDMVDRLTFMQKLGSLDSERQRLLDKAQECTAGVPDKATHFADEILGRVLQLSGQVPSLSSVKAMVRETTSVFLGEQVSWRVEAEIDGVWPEGKSIRLTPMALLTQVWSVTYRDDVDAVETWFSWLWEHVPDGKIAMTGLGATSKDIQRQLKALVRVLTLLGPKQVRLLRYRVGSTQLKPAMAVHDRGPGSRGSFCLTKTETARCRRFVLELLPLIDGTTGTPPEGSMRLVGTAAMDFYDEGLQNHSDTIGAIAFKVVTLESMFLSDDESAEVSYRLRNRVAIALSMLTVIDSSQVIADVKKAYDIRSGFFHGHVRPKDREAATRGLDDRMGDYCRTSISVFMQSGGMNRKSFLRELDTAMVDVQSRVGLERKLACKHFELPLVEEDRTHRH
jgi:hypothetical protein